MKLGALFNQGSSTYDAANVQVIIMGAALVGLNLLLMVFVSLYWTHQGVHQFITGRPL